MSITKDNFVTDKYNSVLITNLPKMCQPAIWRQFDGFGDWLDNGILFPGFCSMAVSHTAAQMSKLVQTLQAWKEGQ